MMVVNDVTIIRIIINKEIESNRPFSCSFSDCKEDNQKKRTTTTKVKRYSLRRKLYIIQPEGRWMLCSFPPKTSHYIVNYYVNITKP